MVVALSVIAIEAAIAVSIEAIPVVVVVVAAVVEAVEVECNSSIYCIVVYIYISRA